MALISVDLPVPSADGVGAAQAVNTMARDKMIVVSGDLRDATIIIEASGSAAGADFVQIAAVKSPSIVPVTAVARRMRVRTRGLVSASGFTANVDIAGDDGTTPSFATLTAPAGDGVGASVDVSAIPDGQRTIWIGGTFTGSVVIEGSQDDVAPFTIVAPYCTKPCFVQLPGSAIKFLRIRREGVSAGAPGLPLIELGGISVGGGAAPPAPTGYVDGLVVNPRNGPDDAQIFVGKARDSTDVYDIVVAATIDLDVSTTGVNGRDAGSASNGWWAIYVIADSTGVNPVAGLLSLNFVTPTLPGGYDVFRRVGVAMRSGGFFRRMMLRQTTSRVRQYWWDDSLSLVTVLNAGSNTGFPSNVAMSAGVPPTAHTAILQVAFDNSGGAATDGFLVQPSTAAGTTSGQNLAPGSLVASPWRISFEVHFDTHIRYAVDNAADTLSLWAQAFNDEI